MRGPGPPRAFTALLAEVSNRGRWGPDDQHGTLNFIDGNKVRSAARLVRTGLVVNCGRSVATAKAADNPRPAVHRMIRSGTPSGNAALAVSDAYSLRIHSLADSHLDALCHVSYKGRMYNGFDAKLVTRRGAGILGLTALTHGIVTRGVLLDIPRWLGLEWLEPGSAITEADLSAAAAAEGIRVLAGDAVLVRTGRAARAIALGPWDLRRAAAGLAPAVLRWLHSARVAVLGTDSIAEVAPSLVRGLSGMPLHVGALVAMGLPLIDHCDLEELARVCVAEKRWEFQFAVAPLMVERASGSPVNPLCVF